MPWDNGTRPHSEPDWELMADLVAATGADGINGDTYSGMPRAFYDTCGKRGHAVVLEPESTAQAGDHILNWNVQSWSKKIPTDVIPSVLKLKWLEPRHVVNIENRWSRDRNNDLQHMFFNGIGYTAWENVWGIWNQLTPRDAETLRRIATIQRQFAPLMVSADWTPYEKTLQTGVFASRFPGTGCAVWTIVNRTEYEISGEQIAIDHKDGTAYFDVWNGVRLEPRIEGGRARCTLKLEAHGFGAILAVGGDKQVPELDGFLEQMSKLARTPLRSLSAEWRAIPQQIVEIEKTKVAREAPAGMVSIPATEYDFAVQGIEIEAQRGTASTCSIRGSRARGARIVPECASARSTSIAIRSRTRSSKRSSTRVTIGRATITISCVIGNAARRVVAGRTNRSRGCRSKTRVLMRSGRASGCRANGNGSTRRRAMMVDVSRGAMSGTRRPCRRLRQRAKCRRLTTSMHIRRARVRSVSWISSATCGSGRTNSSTRTRARRSCAAATTTSRRLRTGTSRRHTGSISTASIC